MSKPESFIMNPDYATLKNSESGKAATVTIPSGVVVPGNGYWADQQDVTISEAQAIVSGRIASSKNSNRSLLGNATDFMRFGSVLGSGALYDVYVFMWRVNPTTVRMQALIQNPYSDNLIGESGAEIFNAAFNTFVAPFG